jgi:hypothetical protein
MQDPTDVSNVVAALKGQPAGQQFAARWTLPNPFERQQLIEGGEAEQGGGFPGGAELGSARGTLSSRAEMEKMLHDRQGGFTNLGVPEGRDPNTGAYIGQVPKFNPGRAVGGQFQAHVDPYRHLPDINTDTFGPASTTKPAPYRQGGRFTTQADYFRNRVPTPEETTPVQQNQMYNQQNMPTQEDLHALLSKIQQAPVSRIDTPEVANWKNLIDELAKK